MGEKARMTKVRRYWAGKAPDWGEEEGLEQGLTGDFEKDDPRLRRLAERRMIDLEEVRADHLRIRKAEMLAMEEENLKLEGGEAEEEEDRRRRIREKLRLQRQQETDLEEEETESEVSTDSETDLAVVGGISLVFVPKSERETIAEQERVEAEKRKLEEAVRRRMEERKLETKQIVMEKIRDGEIQEVEIVDDETEDEFTEYECWKAREIQRIKKDREIREAMFNKNPNPNSAAATETGNKKRKHRTRMRFMQKYYHKGAFFQSGPDDQQSSGVADAIYTRDFSSPTGEDKMDKTMLPKVMQVKRFGRSGRSKYTHLLHQDTTILFPL